MRSLGTWGPAPPTSAASWSFLLGHLLHRHRHSSQLDSRPTFNPGAVFFSFRFNGCCP